LRAPTSKVGEIDLTPLHLVFTNKKNPELFGPGFKFLSFSIAITS